MFDLNIIWNGIRSALNMLNTSVAIPLSTYLKIPVDIAQIGIVAASIYLLIKTKIFESMIMSLAFIGLLLFLLLKYVGG